MVGGFNILSASPQWPFLRLGYIDSEVEHRQPFESTTSGSLVSVDKSPPNHRLMDIKLEIKRCQGELAGLSRIINEVEGDVGRVGHTRSFILH